MTIRLQTLADIATALLIAYAVYVALGQGGGIIPGPSPDGPFLVTAIVESGDTEHRLTIAKLRQRDESGWEHDFQVFDPDDCDAKYKTHPAPSLHVEPIAGGKLIYSGPLSADVDEVIESL